MWLTRLLNLEGRTRRQVAALPWRRGADGLEVLLVTSRETGRWVAPKGGRMAGKSDPEAAAQEALEEAGVEGLIERRPLGTFRYLKRLKRRGPRPTRVTVYALEVLIEHDDWKEASQRRRQWMKPEDAAAAVQEPELSRLILNLFANTGRKPAGR